MSPALLLAVMAAAAAVVLALLVIFRYPLEVVVRTLYCPVKKVLARVAFVRKEMHWGSLEPVDVRDCSLFPNDPLTCEKKCLRS